jgi:hypothetical protein
MEICYNIIINGIFIPDNNINVLYRRSTRAKRSQKKKSYNPALPITKTMMFFCFFQKTLFYLKMKRTKLIKKIIFKKKKKSTR